MFSLCPSTGEGEKRGRGYPSLCALVLSGGRGTGTLRPLPRTGEGHHPSSLPPPTHTGPGQLRGMGSMPLAFTHEDFLITACIWMGKVMFSQVYVCPQGGGVPKTRTGVPLSRPGLEYPALPQARTRTVVRHERYASCVHAGGLSCFYSLLQKICLLFSTF